MSKRWFAIWYCVLISTTFVNFSSAQVVNDNPRSLDAYGDPLPHGAIARLGRIANRPGGPLRFLPDGKTLLIAGTFDNAIYLRDGFTGKTLNVYDVKGRPQIFDISPDGKTVALVDRQDNGGGFLLRDVVSGKDLGRVHVANGVAPITAVFSPDGSLIATSRGNKVVAITETATSKQLCELKFKAVCHRLSFSADGKTLYTGIYENGLVIDHWDARTGKNLHSLTIADKSYNAVVFSPDGKRMALDGSRLMVADAVTGKEIYKLNNVPFGFRAFSPKSDVLAVANLVLDAATGKQIARLELGAHNLAFSPDGKRIASAISSGSPAIWEVATGRPLRPFVETHRGPIRDISVSADGKLVYAAGMGLIYVWDLDKRQLVHKILNPLKSGKWDFVTDGRLLASSMSDGSLVFWDQTNGKEVDRRERFGQVIAIDLSPDGKTLALVKLNAVGKGPKEITLQRWDRAAKNELVPVPPFKLGVSLGLLDNVHRQYAVAFSPDGKWLAANDHRQIFLWEHGAAKPPRTFLIKQATPPSALRFSPDGRLLAAVCDRHLIVWDLLKDDERMRVSFRGIPEPAFDDPVYDAAFSPDGRLLATAHGGSIRIFEVASGEVRWDLKHGAQSLAFTRDQKHLLSAHADSAILLWDMSLIGVDSKRVGEKPSPDDLRARWMELAASARVAFVAQRRLVAAPKATVPFIARQLRRQPLDAERLKKLVASLDAAAFQKRDAASAELRQLGALAEDALRKALRDQPSAEVQRRVKELLLHLDGPGLLQDLRALETLERIGTTDAKDALIQLSKTTPILRLREQALAAVARLEKK